MFSYILFAILSLKFSGLHQFVHSFTINPPSVEYSKDQKINKNKLTQKSFLQVMGSVHGPHFQKLKFWLLFLRLPHINLDLSLFN